MTRATTVVITSSPTFGSECQGPFREVALFPVVVGKVDRAISLLRQFRIRRGRPGIIGCEAPSTINRGGWQGLPATPLRVFVKLPSPSQRAAAVREALKPQTLVNETARTL